MFSLVCFGDRRHAAFVERMRHVCRCSLPARYTHNCVRCPWKLPLSHTFPLPREPHERSAPVGYGCVELCTHQECAGWARVCCGRCVCTEGPRKPAPRLSTWTQKRRCFRVEIYTHLQKRTCTHLTHDVPLKRVCGTPASGVAWGGGHGPREHLGQRCAQGTRGTRSFLGAPCVVGGGAARA